LKITKESSNFLGKHFSITSKACKKTPHTIGVMSWVRSERRRKHLEKSMKEKPKKDHQMLKESVLARIEPEIEFFTTSRVPGAMNEQVMHQHLVQ